MRINHFSDHMPKTTIFEDLRLCAILSSSLKMSRFKLVFLFAKSLHFSAVEEINNKLLPTCFSKFSSNQIRFCSKVTAVESRNRVPDSVSDIHDNPQSTDLSHYGSIPLPSFNLAAYADKSPLIQEFVKLGVELYKFDKDPKIGEYLVGLDFDTNVKPYLTFLHDNGVPADKLGSFVTKNPLIFKESLDDLEVRINYLQSKKFDKEMISQIITKNPQWLSTPVKNIDERLGYLQQTLSLKGDQLREIVTRIPRLGTFPKKYMIHSVFTLKEEIGLDDNELKKVVLTVPSLLTKSTYDTLGTYDYLTVTMNVSRDLILRQPKVLTCRKYKLIERHKFLVSLGRNQYNPLQPGYVPLENLVETTDEEFCDKVAKTSVYTFDEFLKTL